MNHLTFIEEWDENVDISWWAEGRKHLNVVIRAYNAWQREAGVSGRYDPQEGRRLLVMIEEGRQTWANRDGGGGWRDELERIAKSVEEGLRL